jgi:hypothetical protein
MCYLSVQLSSLPIYRICPGLKEPLIGHASCSLTKYAPLIRHSSFAKKMRSLYEGYHWTHDRERQSIPVVSCIKLVADLLPQFCSSWQDRSDASTFAFKAPKLQEVAFFSRVYFVWTSKCFKDTALSKWQARFQHSGLIKCP